VNHLRQRSAVTVTVVAVCSDEDDLDGGKPKLNVSALFNTLHQLDTHAAVAAKFSDLVAAAMRTRPIENMTVNTAMMASRLAIF
jgi:hypothetical protein